ncbi:MAG: hypothetical protein ACYTGG_08415 [Planctomycetota bacterium]|jgi:hypothetical protein
MKRQTTTDDRAANLFVLFGYGAVGIALPLFVLAGQAGMGFGLVFAVSLAIILNLCSRRLLVHMGGAVATTIGCTLTVTGFAYLAMAMTTSPSLWGALMFAGLVSAAYVLPAAALVYTVIALCAQVLRGPGRQMVRDRCRRCGYSLVGLVRRRSPECGTTDRPTEALHATA